MARYFDPEVNHVSSYLGWEQEYFLVDEAFFPARPNLVMTGRTLIGHESAKNQQLEDHYFGSIPSRVEAFMLDLELECHRLGIPVKTRHNEVAPNQFEAAPIFEETNLANDHNLLFMSVMAEVARRHCFQVLLHEKPFDGINGSGKHNNWSLGTDRGDMLFSAGKSPKENLRFICFIANVMAAVDRHNALLKASIASATNAHRLGANEAPPAIISMTEPHAPLRQHREDRFAGRRAPAGRPRAPEPRPLEDSRPHARQYRPKPHQPLCLYGQQV